MLLDLNLPGVKGHDVLEAVRSPTDERVRRMPVVVLSHSEVRDDVVRSYDLGANSHMPSRTRSTPCSRSSRRSGATGSASSRCLLSLARAFAAVVRRHAVQGHEPG